MAGLCRDAKFVAFNLKVEHESLHTRWNRSEVVVLKLLVFSTFVAHQRASGHHQVGTCGIKRLVDQEIFLLPAEVRDNMLYVFIKISRYRRTSLVHAVERTQKRCFVVERLSCV